MFKPIVWAGTVQMNSATPLVTLEETPNAPDPQEICQKMSVPFARVLLMHANVR